MKSRIHYTKPSITELEVQYATDAAATGWGEKCYEYIGRFEQLFREHLGVKHAVATSSCTGALHMGLAGLGIGPGDEVILADINWIATAAPITYLGAEPVLVDIQPDSWCIDPLRVEQAITEKTRAIIAVHLYGNLCNMDALTAIGERHNIPVVEDAAEAIGAVYHGRRAGSLGRFGAFSFHGTKTITTGEGGMFVTNDDHLYERVLTLSNHGRSRAQPKQFFPDVIGYKYKLSNVQAAIGCAQMERVHELIKTKQRILCEYKRALSEIPGIAMNPEPEDVEIGAWMPTVVFPESPGFQREVLLSSLRKRGIDARVFFYPLSSLKTFDHVENPVAYSIAPRAVNLPSYHDLSRQDIAYVADALIDAAANVALTRTQNR